MSLIKDYLLQLSLIAIPLFIYQVFFAERLLQKRYADFMLSLLWGVSVFLCMSMPVRFGDGSHLDIRIIPLLLGTLYSGYRMGLFLTVLIIVYRFSIGFDLGFYNTLFSLACCVPLFLYISKSFTKQKPENRIKITVFLSVYYTLVGITSFYLLGGITSKTLSLYIIHFSFVVGLTWLFAALNEKLTEVHQLRTDFQNSERLRVIGDLTGVFAHEIRNPLQVTRGFLQLLAANAFSDKRDQYVQISIEELDRANGIINDFLSFGKPSENIDERVNVGNEMRRVVNLLQVYASSCDVLIELTISDVCFIQSNPQKLNQVLINIVKNAIESMPNGGTVEVSCTPDSTKYIEIVVKDYGIGMTKEQLNGLGSPYYSLKESGTGLGMMVSYQIIRSMQGKIKVTSIKNEGTIFSIQIPRIS
ncbi:two-component system sporulation sensor kinase B [Paenibacillus castaneae]|uniref:ATP-binding protein n=1 Tax=Paenibacillus castaneae TaxID=474957 RepID=UPI00141B9284|nr:sensor histidine kinase [Paenibacillus castaneae]NIK79623.1 two-component system sporulation sensor kinase B [Paenibacillus castaneae]